MPLPLAWIAWVCLVAGWLLIYFDRGFWGVMLVAAFAALRLFAQGEKTDDTNPARPEPESGSLSRLGRSVLAVLFALGGWLKVMLLRGTALARSVPVIRQIPEPLPENANPDDWLGKEASLVMKILGPCTNRMTIDGVSVRNWNNYAPKIIAYFQYGKCIKVITDENWHLRAKDEAELLEQFNNKEAFMGMTIPEVESLIGTCSSYGSLDFGDETASWSCGKVRVDAYFRKGKCDEVDLSDQRPERSS